MAPPPMSAVPYTGHMRVPRTFIFADLSGFTDYTAAFGDDAAGRILGTFRTLARESASARGVRIAKWLGDGCMTVAVEQAAGIEFITELAERANEVCAPLTLRAGLATGRALLFDGDDYVGSAVNMAARLCDAARPADVLMPVMHLGALPSGISAERHRELHLHGFPGSLAVVSIVGTPPPPSQHDTGELWTRESFT